MPGFGGPIAGGSRLVAVKDARDSATGALVTANAVPSGAAAVTFNLTIADTVGSGFLSMAPGSATTSGSSTINWSGTGQILANASSVDLDLNRTVNVFAGGGGSTNFIVDITGYYL